MTQTPNPAGERNKEIAKRLCVRWLDIDGDKEFESDIVEQLDKKDSTIQALREDLESLNKDNNYNYNVKMMLQNEVDILKAGLDMSDKKLKEVMYPELQSLRAENEKWQKMAQKFVGVSMLADEFANEPHEPESFDRYVENLIGQLEEISSLKAEVEKLKEANLAYESFKNFHNPEMDRLRGENKELNEL